MVPNFFSIIFTAMINVLNSSIISKNIVIYVAFHVSLPHTNPPLLK